MQWSGAVKVEEFGDGDIQTRQVQIGKRCVHIILHIECY